MTDKQAFVWAQDLVAGEHLLLADGRAPPIDGISHHDEVTTVYNLSIANVHTFFVGHDPVLVHNSCFSFARPTNIGDAELQRVVDRVYKGEGSPRQIGNGGMGDAIRNEIATGRQTEGSWHFQAGSDTAEWINNWLAGNPNASASDLYAAQGMMQDLIEALSR